MNQEIGKSAKYDRLCLSLSDDEIKKRIESKQPYVIRLKIPLGEVKFKDIIFGEKCINYNTLDDQILLKSDGYPTYHFANVVDDHLMKITHVIRGEEWLLSTAKHLLIYNCLGIAPPKYAHIPNITTLIGAKLSKRKGAKPVEQLLNDGIESIALCNYLLNISIKGMIQEEEKEKKGVKESVMIIPEITSLDEIAKTFNLKECKTNKIAYDEAKLMSINKDLIKYELQKYKSNDDFWKSKIKMYIHRNEKVDALSPAQIEIFRELMVI